MDCDKQIWSCLSLKVSIMTSTVDRSERTICPMDAHADYLSFPVSLVSAQCKLSAM